VASPLDWVDPKTKIDYFTAVNEWRRSIERAPENVTRDDWPDSFLLKDLMGNTAFLPGSAGFESAAVRISPFPTMDPVIAHMIFLWLQFQRDNGLQESIRVWRDSKTHNRIPTIRDGP
jgi:hypothetical protein